MTKRSVGQKAPHHTSRFVTSPSVAPLDYCGARHSGRLSTKTARAPATASPAPTRRPESQAPANVCAKLTPG